MFSTLDEKIGKRGVLLVPQKTIHISFSKKQKNLTDTSALLNNQL